MTARQIPLEQSAEAQVVRIPLDLALPGQAATVFRDGNRLVLTPAEPMGLRDLLASWDPIEDDLLPIPDLLAQLSGDSIDL